MRGFRWVPAFLVMVGCQPAGGGGGALTEQDKTAIRDQTAAFATAINAHDFATAVSQYADDAIMMPANGPEVSGKANIQAWMAAYPTYSNFSSSSVEVDGAGDMAFSRGSYEMDVTMPGMTAPMHDKGKYIEVLKKQADGSWKVIRDIFNSDMAMLMASPMAGDTAKKK